MSEQETQEGQGPREIGEESEESFTVGGMTYRGPRSTRHARLQLAVEQFRSQVDWLTGYLFIVSEHFESRDDSIPELTVIGYLDEVPTVATDVEAALEEVERLAADLRRVMAGEMPGGPPPAHVCRASDLSPRPDRGSERNYRRGYVHGWLAGLDTMLRLARAGRTPEEGHQACAEFGMGKLSEWRYGDCRELVTPPEFAGKADEPE